MLARQPLTAFAATADPASARAFYEGVLGLPLLADEPFALVFDAAGTELRVSKVEEVRAAPYTVLGWRVSDVDAAARSLADRGVIFERYDAFEHNELGVCTLPTGTRIAWFKDPAGNLLSITQASPSRA